MLRLPKLGGRRPRPDTLAAPQETPPDAAVILLVDDEMAVRQLFSLALRREGYGVVEASNGAEAVVVAQRLPRLDLVITDVVMPVMKGPEFAAALRNDRPDTPVLFVSGYLMGEDLGANAHTLMKPFLRQDLVRKVIEIIGPVQPAGPAAP